MPGVRGCYARRGAPPCPACGVCVPGVRPGRGRTRWPRRARFSSSPASASSPTPAGRVRRVGRTPSCTASGRGPACRPLRPGPPRARPGRPPAGSGSGRPPAGSACSCRAGRRCRPVASPGCPGVPCARLDLLHRDPVEVVDDLQVRELRQPVQGLRTEPPGVQPDHGPLRPQSSSTTAVRPPTTTATGSDSTSTMSPSGSGRAYGDTVQRREQLGKLRQTLIVVPVAGDRENLARLLVQQYEGRVVGPGHQ